MERAESARLQFDLERKRRSDRAFQKMLRQREGLPAFKMRDRIVRAVREHQVVVVSGETGCGKTTQLPQIVYEDACERGEGGSTRRRSLQGRGGERRGRRERERERASKTAQA